jgi:hypothetical protein
MRSQTHVPMPLQTAESLPESAVTPSRVVATLLHDHHPSSGDDHIPLNIWLGIGRCQVPALRLYIVRSPWCNYVTCLHWVRYHRVKYHILQL